MSASPKHSSNMRTAADCNNEEEVKIHVALPWLESLGYKKDCMNFGEAIPVQEGRKKKTIFADIVIYNNKSKETPLIVVDTKGPMEILSKADREQVISYARLLPLIAPLAVLTNGHTVQVFRTVDKTRLKELPTRKKLASNFMNTVISESTEKALRNEATKQLFAIDDVQTFKSLLSKCHNEIRNNEGYDPAQAFDELSKVLFAKMYEEQFHKEANRFTLATFDDTLNRLNVNIVQQQFQDIQKNPAYRDLFPRGTTIELQDRTIRTIVGIFEHYDLTLTRFDVKGEAFEYFLSDTFTGGLGEYFTPRNIVEFMVDAVSPRIGFKIIDPFCGTGGFLIYAFDVISGKIRLNDFADDEKRLWLHRLSTESLFGTDWKTKTSQACKMNMVVHGDGNSGIFLHNGLVDVPNKIEEGTFDLCLTNPPFGAYETDPEVLKLFELGAGRKSQKREILAMERCIRLVKPGGIVAMVIIDGVLNNDSSEYVREYINREAEILAVIGLNKETFEGYNATAKSSVLILKRKEDSEVPFNSQSVYMAVCQNTGYAPNGLQIAGNQLPDILFDYHSYENKQVTGFIHPYTKVVTISDPSQRLDAEHYISVMEENEFRPPLEIATNGHSSAAMLATGFESLRKALLPEYDESDFIYFKMNDLIKEVSSREVLTEDDKYRLLGVRWWAEGVFEREVKYGKDIKAKQLNKVDSGWLIYNRLFASKGSFGMVDGNTQGGYVSNEFPTFQAKKSAYDSRGLAYNSDDLLEYIVFYLTAPPMMDVIERSATGSTKQSRGRFKEQQLLELTIPIPSTAENLSVVANSIRQIKQLRSDIRQLAEEMKSLPASLQVAFPQMKK